MIVHFVQYDTNVHITRTKSKPARVKLYINIFKTVHLVVSLRKRREIHLRMHFRDPRSGASALGPVNPGRETGKRTEFAHRR